MEWMQAFMIAGSTIGACWMMHKENKDLSKKFNEETKDFHARLCVLEEKYIQMMREVLENRNK
jgi:hypothetical protein